jgi:anti-anti-sigma regulatory factor
VRGLPAAGAGVQRRRSDALAQRADGGQQAARVQRPADRDGHELGAAAGAALAGTTVSVLCQYDRERFDPVTLATVAPFHTRSVAAATYYADALLRICRQYAPPGIRVAGEIDYRREEPLALALAEAIRLDGNVTINLADLTFVDGPCARMILDAVRGLAASRSVEVRCHPAIADTFALLGVRDVAGVSLVSADDR